MQLAPGLFADARDVLDSLPDILPDGILRLDGRTKFLERARQRADAAFNSGGQKFREQIEQQIGVSHALRRRPVGPVNLFLDARAVKLAVGKAVDRENVAGIFVEPALKRESCAGIAQFHRRAFAQAQADGERILRAHFCAHGQRVMLERSKRFRPRFAAMDVRAVSKLERMFQLHGRQNRMR